MVSEPVNSSAASANVPKHNVDTSQTQQNNQDFAKGYEQGRIDAKKGLKREKVIQQVKNLINSSYSFQGYLQFSNEIAKKSGGLQDISTKTKIKNLQNEYSDRLIVIDEVHNIRISDDNENKNIAKNLMYLVSVVSNIRLLLLSATPMFNSYKEIVWLLNLMNMNDRRGIVSVSDIFDKNGDFK
jgi:hypothetical protein